MTIDGVDRHREEPIGDVAISWHTKVTMRAIDGADRHREEPIGDVAISWRTKVVRLRIASVTAFLAMTT